jgi:hypothetical protein
VRGLSFFLYSLQKTPLTLYSYAQLEALVEPQFTNTVPPEMRFLLGRLVDIPQPEPFVKRMSKKPLFTLEQLRPIPGDKENKVVFIAPPVRLLIPAREAQIVGRIVPELEPTEKNNNGDGGMPVKLRYPFVFPKLNGKVFAEVKIDPLLPQVAKASGEKRKLVF